MTDIVRAVDVGYGLTKYVTSATDNHIKCAHFPSVAPLGGQPEAAATLGAKRRTITIPVGNLLYEVGPDIHLADDITKSAHMHDAYCTTDEYLALLRGALRYMNLDHITLLVLGLPVSACRLYRAALERRSTGTHDLGRGRRVTIESVKVLPQPQGALVHYGVDGHRLAQLRRERNLVIDAGSRTFDWLISQGLGVIDKRSHSATRGMFDVLDTIAAGISRAKHTQFRDHERIDRALRERTNPKVFGTEYDLSPHLPAAKKIAEEAVGEMLRYVGDGSDVDHIAVVGGGAFFFGPAIKAAFPKHSIQPLHDGLYANVRGFQIAGQELVRVERERTQRRTDSAKHLTEA